MGRAPRVARPETKVSGGSERASSAEASAAEEEASAEASGSSFAATASARVEGCGSGATVRGSSGGSRASATWARSAGGAGVAGRGTGGGSKSSSGRVDGVDAVPSSGKPPLLVDIEDDVSGPSSVRATTRAPRAGEAERRGGTTRAGTTRVGVAQNARASGMARVSSRDTREGCARECS